MDAPQEGEFETAGIEHPLACPVCAAAAYAFDHPLSGKTLVAMANALGIDQLPSTALVQGVARCEGCGLEFANPMRNPGEEFYVWLTTAKFPYPKHRWEWDEAARILEETSSHRSTVVLDAGSGEGRFLEAISRIPGVIAHGIDQNPDVVAASVARGLNVHHGDLSSFGLDGVSLDVVTFWHVVEHVDDPIGMLERARECLSERGLIMFSVPITPMSYEHAWPDPFNMPPHHLTRWSVKSLQALATRLDMQVSMILPDASSVLARTLRSLVLQTSPSSASWSRAAKAGRLLRHLMANPGRLISEMRRQAGREKHNGKTLPDVVLVVLRKHS